MGAIEYFKDRPLILVGLAALAAFTVWMCIKAGKAAAKRQKENEQIMKKLAEYTELRREFEQLTPEKAAAAEPERLFKGVALGLVKRIEKSADMQKEFDKFSEEQRMLYALWFVFEDGEKKLSGFFRANGSPLTDCAKSAFDKFYGGELAEIFTAEYTAFDEDDETTSLIPEKIEALDERFARISGSTDMFGPVSQFITERTEAFLN